MSIIKADVTYDDGTVVSFSGVSQDSALDITTIPSDSPIEKEADTTPATPTDEVKTDDASVTSNEPAPVDATVDPAPVEPTPTQDVQEVNG